MPNPNQALEIIRDTISELNAGDNTTCENLKSNLATMFNKVVGTLTAAGFAPDGTTPDLSVCCDCE